MNTEQFSTFCIAMVIIVFITGFFYAITQHIISSNMSLMCQLEKSKNQTITTRRQINNI